MLGQMLNPMRCKMIWDDYECEGQMTIDDWLNQDKEPLKFRKPVRLIELFAGIGSQAMALKEIGCNFEHYRVVEFDKFAIKSYNAIHGTDFPTIDVTKIHGVDLGIVDRVNFTYLLTRFHAPICQFVGSKLEWKKGVEQGQAFYGKLKDFLRSVGKSCLRY